MMPRADILLCCALALMLNGASAFTNNHGLRYSSNQRKSVLTTIYADKSSKAAKGNRLIVFGLGNVGTLVAKRSTDFTDGNSDVPFFDHVYGTTRSGKDSPECVESIDFDSYEKLEEILPTCTHVLITIPPVDPSTTAPSNDENNDATLLLGGRPIQWKYFCDRVLNHPTYSIQDLLPSNSWVGFVSSTSVYGNHDGEWVSEESEVKCKPGTNGELYYRAENEWRNASKECGWRMHVFRCAGLYGNGRSAIHTLRKKGIASIGLDGERASAGEEKRSKKISPTSRIHEEDVSRAILSAMMNNEPVAGESCLWNLADDNPAERNKVMEFGKELLAKANLLREAGSTKTTQQSKTALSLSGRERRRLLDRKRVANLRMKDLLLPDGTLLYPSYREGLHAVLEANKEKWSS